MYTFYKSINWELWGSNPRGNIPLGLKSNTLTTRSSSLMKSIYIILSRPDLNWQPFGNYYYSLIN